MSWIEDFTETEMPSSAKTLGFYLFWKIAVCHDEFKHAEIVSARVLNETGLTHQTFKKQLRYLTDGGWFYCEESKRRLPNYYELSTQYRGAK